MCYPGYFNDTNGCSACIEGCDDCYNGTTCLAGMCSVGYVNNSDNTCDPCPEGCDLCMSSTECIACSEGYILTSSGDCYCED